MPPIRRKQPRASKDKCLLEVFKETFDGMSITP